MFQNLRNVFSISMFDVMGLTIKIDHDTVKILKGVSLVVKGTKINVLYILNGSILIAHTPMAS